MAERQVMEDCWIHISPERSVRAGVSFLLTVFAHRYFFYLHGELVDRQGQHNVDMLGHLALYR